MKLSQLLRTRQITVSCARFPPKPGSSMDLDTILRDTAALTADHHGKEAMSSVRYADRVFG